jgi:phosphatidyl-myo-inositol dimannoside synthase
MRILMLDNELPPLGGGMGTANLELLKQFVDFPEIEIDLVTSAIGGKPEFEKFSNHINIYKVPVWNKNIHHSSNRELILYAIQALFKAIHLQQTNPYDFCFAWSALPAGAVALALLRIKRLPYMVWVSGPDIPGFEQRYERLYPLLLPLIRRIWRNAAPLIAKCPEEKDMIVGIENHLHVEVIPNGADVSGFIQHQSPPTTEPLRLICVARLIERKGQRHLIQAVKQLIDRNVDVQLNLVGTGDSLDAYQQLTDELGLTDKVIFSGYIAREALGEYYQNSDVFILPSYNEGMSLAALEAMAAGLPILLTRTGGTADLVKDGVNGFTFDWADVDAITRYVSQLNEDRLLMKKMGLASRARAETFAWPAIAKRYLDLFSVSCS